MFDLETTGAKAPPCRVTEIGAYRVKGGQVVEEFQTLVNPETPIPPFISMLTGITDEMVRNVPLSRTLRTISCVRRRFVLVAHNSGFDMGFINHEIGGIFGKYRLANPCLCTVQLSRRLLPDILNHKLKTVAEHYSIDLVNHHRAAADAFATAHVFINLINKLQDNGVTDLATLRRLAARGGKRKSLSALLGS